MRKHYWSCSSFADWLRGTAKPGAATSEDWAVWRKTARNTHKFRYWLAEEALDRIQNIIWWVPDRLYDIKYYINNRWVTSTHALTAHHKDIPRGEWRDLGNRFLPCLFNELRDFVEIELAWSNIAWSNKGERAKYNSPFWALGWFRWRTWRCPQAGLDNLDWQSRLVWEADHCEPNSPLVGQPTPQALAAREIRALYDWWVNIYPNRPDPHDASGWSAYCDMRRDSADSDDNLPVFATPTDPEMVKQRDTALARANEIEAQYDQEDTEMLVRLIKIRNSLWT